jgi:hypothetical protein
MAGLVPAIHVSLGENTEKALCFQRNHAGCSE